MFSTTHKNMQCFPDGHQQIADYISLLVTEICFLLLHYPSWGKAFSLFALQQLNDIYKTFLCCYVHTNNPEQISFVTNELCYQEDSIFGCEDM